MNICEKCLKEIKNDSINSHLPENGLIVKIEGYYGGFDDPSDYTDMTIIICHDCSLELFKSIPKLQNRKGCHYSHSASQCCDFSWTEKDFLKDLETQNQT